MGKNKEIVILLEVEHEKTNVFSADFQSVMKSKSFSLREIGEDLFFCFSPYILLSVCRYFERVLILR